MNKRIDSSTVLVATSLDHDVDHMWVLFMWNVLSITVKENKECD